MVLDISHVDLHRIYECWRECKIPSFTGCINPPLQLSHTGKDNSFSLQLTPIPQSHHTDASEYSLLVRVSGPVGVFNRFRHSHHPGWLFLLGLDQQAHQVTHNVTVLSLKNDVASPRLPTLPVRPIR